LHVNLIIIVFSNIVKAIHCQTQIDRCSLCTSEYSLTSLELWSLVAEISNFDTLKVHSLYVRHFAPNFIIIAHYKINVALRNAYRILITAYCLYQIFYVFFVHCHVLNLSINIISSNFKSRYNNKITTNLSLKNRILVKSNLVCICIKIETTTLFLSNRAHLFVKCTILESFVEVLQFYPLVILFKISHNTSKSQTLTVSLHSSLSRTISCCGGHDIRRYNLTIMLYTILFIGRIYLYTHVKNYGIASYLRHNKVMFVLVQVLVTFSYYTFVYHLLIKIQW
jgi:hypothetical protein